MPASISPTQTEFLLQALERHSVNRPPATFCHFWHDDIREDIFFQELRFEAAGYANLYRHAGANSSDVGLIMLQHSPGLYYSFAGAMLPATVAMSFQNIGELVDRLVELTSEK